MKHEAVIILPLANNKGEYLDQVHRDLTREIVTKFGGVTKSKAEGYYMVGKSVCNEEVSVYTIAAEDCIETRNALRFLAANYGMQAEQECVYVRYPDGTVNFVQCLGTTEAFQEAVNLIAA